MPVPQDYVPIPGTERTPMHGARMVAAADPNERMQVTVMVRPKQSLAAATARVNSDTPPSERRHMTHEEYRAEFGADPTDLTKVQSLATDIHAGIASTVPAVKGGTPGAFLQDGNLTIGFAPPEPVILLEE